MNVKSPENIRTFVFKFVVIISTIVPLLFPLYDSYGKGSKSRSKISERRTTKSPPKRGRTKSHKKAIPTGQEHLKQSPEIKIIKPTLENQKKELTIKKPFPPPKGLGKRKKRDPDHKIKEDKEEIEIYSDDPACKKFERMYGVPCGGEKDRSR